MGAARWSGRQTGRQTGHWTGRCNGTEDLGFRTCCAARYSNCTYKAMIYAI
jgi:hypothetical protein